MKKCKQEKQLETYLYKSVIESYRSIVFNKNNKPLFCKNWTVARLNYFVKDFKKEVASKKEARTNSKISLKNKSFAEILLDKKIEKISDLVGSGKYADGIIVSHSREIEEELKFFVTENVDYNYYSKSYGHPRITKQGHLTFSISFLNSLRLSDIELVDNLVTIKNISIKNIDGLKVSKSVILKTTRAGYRLETMFIATNGTVNYHSSDSLRKAVQGLKRKIKRIIKENEPINLDTVITPSLYHKLTGACYVGIREFMNKNEIAKSINAKELLEIIGDNFGAKKFKSLIKE